MSVSVCIATYRRTERLCVLLEDLGKQEVLPDQVVVVDNDVAGSARATVEEFKHKDSRLPISYEIQPERNISATRNRTVHLATADWMAFIDDDERAPPQWLRLLLESAARFQADGVLAPVEPQLPAAAPAWIRRGKFYDWPHVPTGAVVPLKHLRFGNVLLRGRLLREEPGPFDPAYGLSTGEDGDLLLRLIDKGARIVWCDEALVWEPIEPKRLSLRWLLQRSLSGGQQHARLAMQGRYHRVNGAMRAALIARWCAQLVIALVLAALSWPWGRHRAVAWLIKAWANFGKLSMLSRWRYSEYA